ncbi:MAG: hypothetical protein CLLPBCKN_006382 [Chroococcidiopsis cubana SAG 39.79]|uniref:DUF2808 domain-containing protein n=1 Tax=Chroococcidiopsis cubana SAG 39.79 TaxID=388085 RepID=A0AB37UA46_9CYAN|nr:DUF2808 domain-containing protein [Chroococcidiopsis cubana]MDZ4876947.1 hypothetical protein [Chroococcidiopsis cubana SAG 39.79]PSB63493.1 hypothetical protein C7B79_13720 [Chroococcidiopsis cubana CCALA 043]RUT02641.1 hypothetical protein DSM107010_62190 [Chroococcidiopsis cubana SAG 39.79]
MKVSKRLGLGLTLLASLGVLGAPSVQAVKLRDGTIQFVQPPQLVKARVTDISPGVSASYYFTIHLPQAAGEPLQKITLTQQLGKENLAFNLKGIRAETKTEPELTLGEIANDRQQKTISIGFNPPVPPGQTVTIRLRSVKNPSFGGVYLFKVAAFPPGEKVRSQYLGLGRFQFTSPGGTF